MTTTTTSGTGTGTLPSGSNSFRSSLHRNRCLSGGSQTTLNSSLSKIDVYANGRGNSNNEALPHRKLQKQISQLSSLGDANSLLETEDPNVQFQQGQPHTNSNRRNDLRRSLIINNANKLSEDCGSLDSSHWDKEGIELSQRRSDEETDLFPKPVAPLAPFAARQAPCLTPVNSVAQLTQPPRTRLKLSRIITRRNKGLYELQNKPRVELIHANLPGMGHADYTTNINSKLSKNKLHNIKSQESKVTTPFKSSLNGPSNTLESLMERFSWQNDTKMEVEHEAASLTNKPTSPTISKRNDDKTEQST